MDKERFKGKVDGKEVALYTLSNANGVEIDILNLGAKIVAIRVPDREGKKVDIVLGMTVCKIILRVKRPTLVLSADGMPIELPRESLPLMVRSTHCSSIMDLMPSMVARRDLIAWFGRWNRHRLQSWFSPTYRKMERRGIQANSRCR